jgi:hypothetical protein
LDERIAANDVQRLGPVLDRLEQRRDVLRSADFKGGDIEA